MNKFFETDSLSYAGMSVKDNVTTTTLNSAAIVQVTVFDTNGLSRDNTPDHTNDHILIGKPGVYKAIFSASVANNASQTHDIDVSLYKNNGATELTNVHAHRTLTGGSGDLGSLTGSGLIELDTDETIEIWATTEDAADRVVTFSDLTLSIIRIGN